MRKFHIIKAKQRVDDSRLDFDDDDDQDSEDFAVYQDSSLQTTYRIYFPQSIENDLSLYHSLLEQFRTAKENDIVNILMQCYGGSCSVGMSIKAAMKDCKAAINVRIVGSCYSMGAQLALCGDRLSMESGTVLMFHNYTGGEFGKGGELLDAVKNSAKSLAVQRKLFCSPFLTDDEIENLSRDKDVYIHAEDKSFKARCARHFPIMKKAYDAQAKETRRKKKK